MNTVLVREALPSDAGRIFELITHLAEYERLRHKLIGSQASLQRDLFGDQPVAYSTVAEFGGNVVGFALYFISYSTFRTQPGIWLEDLFVLPEHRRQGIGQLLLSKLAAIAVTRGYGRFEWSVLDWNESAIEFYRQMGATTVDGWLTCRVEDQNLAELASRSAQS